MSNLKLRFSSILTAVVFLQVLHTTCALDCTYNGPMGISVSIKCPALLQDDDKVFCCYNSGSIPHCCDLNEYIQSNTPILAGIIVGAIVLLLLIILCCCCCCSCCFLAQRRQQRGTVF